MRVLNHGLDDDGEEKTEPENCFSNARKPLFQGLEKTMPGAARAGSFPSTTDTTLTYEVLIQNDLNRIEFKPRNTSRVDSV